MRKKIIYNPATKKFENMDPDVPTITKRLNQIRRKDDQLPTYDKDQGTFVKGNKKGALSDFEIIEAYHSAKEEDKKLFEPMLNRLRNEPSAVEKWNVIHKSMTPKERREFYKDKKEKPKDMYDDIPKVIMPDPKPIDEYIKMKSEFSNNFSDMKRDEEVFKRISKRKVDPDLEMGLGYLMGVSDKD